MLNISALLFFTGKGSNKENILKTNKKDVNETSNVANTGIMWNV